MKSIARIENELSNYQECFVVVEKNVIELFIYKHVSERWSINIIGNISAPVYCDTINEVSELLKREY
jgi:hypothetical protein|tara:strand:+ start:303 stop:503 length:201 start_codon:yes stop_codon:yes gene_type:complete